MKKESIDQQVKRVHAAVLAEIAKNPESIESIVDSAYSYLMDTNLDKAFIACHKLKTKLEASGIVLS